MIQSTYQPQEKENVRTQITLPKKLKKMIEEKASQKNLSLSEYLRRAARISLSLEKEDEEELNRLANLAIGSLDLSKHPEWQNLTKIKKWQKEARKEW